MIHKVPDVIFPETLQLLTELQADPLLSNFFLVGGTALAFQIGHRHSIDLDLFCLNSFSQIVIEEHLQETYNFYTDVIAKIP